MGVVCVRGVLNRGFFVSSLCKVYGLVGWFPLALSSSPGIAPAGRSPGRLKIEDFGIGPEQRACDEGPASLQIPPRRRVRRTGWSGANAKVPSGPPSRR